MSFFKEALGIIAPIAGTIFGGAPGGVAATALAGLITGDETVTKVGTGPGLAAAVKAGQITLADVGGPTVVKGIPGIVTGRLRKRTIVQTFDPVTGKVISMKTTAGGVAVFAADAAAAKRFFRQIRKLDARLPRKLTRQSPVKQLTDRVIKNALERAGDDPSCPK